MLRRVGREVLPTTNLRTSSSTTIRWCCSPGHGSLRPTFNTYSWRDSHAPARAVYSGPGHAVSVRLLPERR